jgi:predicted metal-dependent peptidase
LPVLSPGDRRSFARALWSPLLPEAVWPSPRRLSGGTAQVYLDVSGSMSAEMPLIVALLNRLGRHIRRPFWAFSNVVAPAIIRGGQLEAETTGGTSMNCVLEHLAQTLPGSAVVVTDGYIEKPNEQLLRRMARVRLHVVVTRDGSTAALDRAGIACTQLGRLPQ